MNSGAVWGVHAGSRRSVEPEVMITPSVDVTTQLSDMSDGSLIVEAEHRMAAYEAYGSSAALVDLVNRLPLHSSGSSPLTLPTPVNTFSFFSMKKKVVLMTVAVEFEVGKTDMIPIYEGEDSDADCAKLAAAFVESHGLDAAVVRPLTEHLIRTVELQRNGELSDLEEQEEAHEVPAPPLNVRQCQAAATTTAAVKIGTRYATCRRRSSSQVDQPVVQRPATVRSAPRSNTRNSPSSSTRIDPNNGSFATTPSSRAGGAASSRPKAQPTTFARTVSRESNQLFSNEPPHLSGSQYSHVSSRYRSPTKRNAQQPALPPDVCTHKPKVCDGTKVIVDTQVRSRRTLYERLYSENEGILARKREMSEQRARAASEQRKYTDHQVKGLNWETTQNAANAIEAGQRLYQQGVKQRQTLAQRQARAHEEREKKNWQR